MSDNYFNKYTDMPQIPYKILLYLMEHNENLFKLLKYNTIDALSKPNLTIEEKKSLLYKDEGIETDYSLFLKPLVTDEMLEECSQLRFYKSVMIPMNNLNTVLTYEFDIIIGSKMTLVYDEQDIPCSRTDLIEKELLSTLNGINLFGVGYFQFNKELSNNCSQRLSISNSKTFYGSALCLCCNYMDVEEDNCGF